jgi:hypothetical protein
MMKEESKGMREYIRYFRFIQDRLSSIVLAHVYDKFNEKAAEGREREREKYFKFIIA